jgi:hypothetical protein
VIQAGPLDVSGDFVLREDQHGADVDDGVLGDGLGCKDPATWKVCDVSDGLEKATTTATQKCRFVLGTRTMHSCRVSCGDEHSYTFRRVEDEHEAVGALESVPVVRR